MPRTRRRSPRYRKPPLTVRQILSWADDFKRRRARWPRHRDGRIRPLDENWHAINVALGRGNRGLPGGSSLAKLVALHRGKRNLQGLPPLDEETIVDWARRHHRRTGSWPSLHHGPIHGVPGETWFAVDSFALRRGTRGLPGRSSLADLLAAHGLKLNLKRLSNLTERQILAWADAFHVRHRRWPARDSGQITEAPFETWYGIDRALRFGLRDLAERSSLPAFLNIHRGLFNGKSRPPKYVRPENRLNEQQILEWANRWRRKTGHWPKRDSGRIPGTQGETWAAVDSALKSGCRGLRGGSSLVRLLSEAADR